MTDVNNRSLIRIKDCFAVFEYQIRKGSNKIGVIRILQLFSDAVELFTKEQTYRNFSNTTFLYIKSTFDRVSKTFKSCEHLKKKNSFASRFARPLITLGS